jgi:hypothetical protein
MTLLARLSKLLGLTLLLALTLIGPASARGLSFSEEMHGYAYYQGEFRHAHVFLHVVVVDIDAWRSNPSYAANISGTLVMDRVVTQPISGTLQILAPAPNDDGRLLTYRFHSGSLQFTGLKHVRDAGGVEVVDDMTTLHGVFQPLAETPPSVFDLLYGNLWSSELHFEWWNATTVWNFVTSFVTINTPWYEDWSVKALFVETVLGVLASTLCPWFF